MVVILNKVKSFFKENWKFLIFLVLFYMFMTYELPYVIYSPGGSINMSERISGDNTYSESGSISMTYVSMVRGSIPFLLASYIIPNWDIVSTDKITYDGNTLDDTVEIDKIYMKETISNAEGIAYETANIDYDILSKKTIVTNKSTNALTNLKYGDEIISIDDIKINGLKELQDYVTKKSIGDKVEVKYIRDSKEYTDTATLIDVGGLPKIGIGIATIKEYDTDYNIKVKTKSSESGPSGGLMTALEIYNKITLDDITKGHKIMGTGTMESDGSVGEIGGVKYKLIGAVRKGADVFICPEENYEEAKKLADERNYDIILIAAKTFSEAIESLKSLE